MRFYLKHHDVRRILFSLRRPRPDLEYSPHIPSTSLACPPLIVHRREGSWGLAGSYMALSSKSGQCISYSRFHFSSLLSRHISHSSPFPGLCPRVCPFKAAEHVAAFVLLPPPHRFLCVMSRRGGASWPVIGLKQSKTVLWPWWFIDRADRRGWAAEGREETRLIKWRVDMADRDTVSITDTSLVNWLQHLTHRPKCMFQTTQSHLLKVSTVYLVKLLSLSNTWW